MSSVLIALDHFCIIFFVLFVVKNSQLSIYWHFDFFLEFSPSTNMSFSGFWSNSISTYIWSVICHQKVTLVYWYKDKEEEKVGEKERERLRRGWERYWMGMYLTKEGLYDTGGHTGKSSPERYLRFYCIPLKHEIDHNTVNTPWTPLGNIMSWQIF